MALRPTTFAYIWPTSAASWNRILRPRYLITEPSIGYRFHAGANEADQL